MSLMQPSGSAITRRRLLGTAAGSGSQTGCAQRRAATSRRGWAT